MRLTPSLLLLVTGACTSPPPRRPGTDAGSRSFHADDQGFSATVGEIEATASHGALSLRAHGGGFELRTVGLGRGEVQLLVDSGAPALGDCTAELDPRGDCVRRVEQRRGGLTEWYASAPGGVEQGWEISAPPPGEGSLLIQVALSGATATGQGAELRLTDARGRPWTYGGLNAWDASGRQLAARMVAEGDQIRVELDDEGVEYPVQVDPLISTSATEITTYSGDQFGFQVASAGDVNGDGYDDVVVGSDGAVFVYHGGASGLDVDASSFILATATERGFGASVAGAGDLNGDGYDDIVAGAADYMDDTGLVSVFYGSASGISATVASEADVILVGEETDSGFGVSVARAGDVNGDGYDDLIVGADLYDTTVGRAYVFYGSASGVSALSAADADVTLEGSRGSSFGYSVARAGDLNADGYDDLVVGGYSTDKGTVYVFHGSASGITAAGASEADATLTGEARSDDFGYAVASAGDVNGDGYDDLVVAAERYAWYTVGGRAYVFLGSASGITAASATDAHATLTGFVDQDYLHGSVASAGDLDGDGYDEIVFGACASARVGKTYVFRGSASGITATKASGADPTIAGVGEDNFFGCSVASAGDVNSDGFADLVVGDPYYYANGAYLFLGSTDGVTVKSASDADTALVSGTDAADIDTFDWAGDLNGDGYDDLVVGSPGYPTESGWVYVYYGSAAGVTATTTGEADLVLVGAASGDEFGSTVSPAGDLNADGYDDLIVGAEGYLDDTGRAYVFYGSASGITATGAADADVTLTGEADAASGFGQVAPAGDVNGDGFDDVAVGAEQYGGSYTGRIYVFYGSASGPTATGASDADATIQAEGYDTHFGRDLTTGDLNGDGYDDLVVGAYGVKTIEGSASIFLGSASGITATTAAEADVIITGEGASYLGHSLASGDVNGDGYDDLVVGAPAIGDTVNQVYVFLGSASGVMATGIADADSVLADDVGNFFGSSIASAGDLNGDGYDDIAIGAEQYGDKVGRVSVFYGSASGITATSASEADTTLSGEDGAYSKFGTVSSAGDMNGDGYDDLIVLAPYAWPDGKLYIYMGGCDDTTGYADRDGDGHGDSAVEATICGVTPGYAFTSDDCDDASATVYPGADEIIGDGIDQDCDGIERCYVDADDDGFRPEEGGTVTGATFACDAAGEASSADPDGDCDDADPTRHPGATDTPDDGIDQDCDGADSSTEPDTAGETDTAGGTDTAGETDTAGGTDTPGGSDSSDTDTPDSDLPGADGDGPSTDPKGSGCACSSAGAGAGWFPASLLVFALSRRRSRGGAPA